jgi:hypothetical protein
MDRTNRMESPPRPRRFTTTLALTLPFMVPISIILLLAGLSNICVGWWAFFFRLSTSIVFLHELLRSAGLSSVTVRSRQLIRLIKPEQLYLNIYIIFWLYQALLIVGFSYLEDKNQLDGCKGSESSANPDIVGSGVRLSMYILFFTVFASLFVGSFHGGLSGTKELGIAILISTYRSVGTISTLCHRILIERRSHILSNQPPEGQNRRLDADRCDRCHGHDRHALCHTICDSFVQGRPRVALVCSACYRRTGSCLGSSPLHRHTIHCACPL